jgi:phage recombination protein Bet
MTEMVTYTPPSQTALTIADDQHQFTDAQTQALTHIGVENASQGDLAVFFHVVKRTGLDPFARQIYMIGRQSSEKDANGNWVKVTKQTIQTGIDGYRLIGRRAAARTGETISVEAPEWCRDTGAWVPVWSAAWGLPLAARVTIRRDGQPFTAVANFDEYKQTKRDGSLNAMWTQRPAGQIAKCAEAAAWRMAFPQDLADIYTDDEMGQADNPPPAKPRRETAATLLAPATRKPDDGDTPDSAAEMDWDAELDKRAGDVEGLRELYKLAGGIDPNNTALAARIAQAAAAAKDAAETATTAGEPIEAEVVDELPAEPMVTQADLKRLHTVLTKLEVKPENKHQDVGTLAGHEITSTKELTRAEFDKVITVLDGCLKDPEPQRALDFALANAAEGVR